MSASRRALGLMALTIMVGAGSTAATVCAAAALPTALPIADAASARAAGLVFTPLRAGGDYVSGERAGWTVTRAAGAKPAAGRYSFRITRDERAVVATGTFDLSSAPAEIDLPRGEPGSFKVVVDYMAPPPPPPLDAAQARELNAALRRLLIDTDPSLASVLDKYPHYRLVPAWRFDIKSFMENRVVMLHAVVHERASGVGRHGA